MDESTEIEKHLWFSGMFLALLKAVSSEQKYAGLDGRGSGVVCIYDYVGNCKTQWGSSNQGKQEHIWVLKTKIKEEQDSKGRFLVLESERGSEGLQLWWQKLIWW
jgi:hypothetical protein